METFSCFKKKEVISICDGMRLGFPSDLEFDLRNGKICKIIVPEGNKYLGFFCNDREYRIPWECIRKIGDDIILVDIVLEEVLFTGDN
ncbi:MAG: PRC-barrel domain-containing protein [Anaerotignaceae bacterium]